MAPVDQTVNTLPPQPAAPPTTGSVATLPRSGDVPAALGPTSVSAGPIVAGLLLAALAVAALLMTRRRRRVGRFVEILESSSLGPKRSLVVARMGDELLLLGTSESGIALLTTRPAAELHPEEPQPVEPLFPASIAGLVDRFRRRSPGSAAPGFESMLCESAEDEELRRKLASGMTGSIR